MAQNHSAGQGSAWQYKSRAVEEQGSGVEEQGSGAEEQGRGGSRQGKGHPMPHHLHLKTRSNTRA